MRLKELATRIDLETTDFPISMDTGETVTPKGMITSEEKNNIFPKETAANLTYNESNSSLSVSP